MNQSTIHNVTILFLAKLPLTLEEKFLAAVIGGADEDEIMEALDRAIIERPELVKDYEAFRAEIDGLTSEEANERLAIKTAELLTLASVADGLAGRVTAGSTGEGN